MSARTYFLGNRLWWFGALCIAPVVAAIIGTPIAGLIAATILLLPAFIVFDTDRGWWSDDIRMLLQDRERSRTEVRLLTGSAGAGLALGVVIAFLIV